MIRTRIFPQFVYDELERPGQSGAEEINSSCLRMSNWKIAGTFYGEWGSGLRGVYRLLMLYGSMGSPEKTRCTVSLGAIFIMDSKPS